MSKDSSAKAEIWEINFDGCMESIDQIPNQEGFSVVYEGAMAEFPVDSKDESCSLYTQHCSEIGTNAAMDNWNDTPLVAFDLGSPVPTFADSTYYMNSILADHRLLYNERADESGILANNNGPVYVDSLEKCPTFPGTFSSPRSQDTDLDITSIFSDVCHDTFETGREFDGLLETFLCTSDVPTSNPQTTVHAIQKPSCDPRLFLHPVDSAPSSVIKKEVNLSAEKRIAADKRKNRMKKRLPVSSSCVRKGPAISAAEAVRGGSLEKNLTEEERQKRIKRVKNRESVEKCRNKQKIRLEVLERERNALRNENNVLDSVTNGVRSSLDTIASEVAAVTGQRPTLSC